MLPSFLAGFAAAAIFVLVLHLAGLLWDRGAGAMSLIVVACLYPVYAIASGSSSFGIHLSILGAFAALGFAGYVIAPRLIALAVLCHAAFDTYFIATFGTSTPWWILFCCGFDVLLGTVFLRTLGPRT